jgi:hypothetical protein
MIIHNWPKAYVDLTQPYKTIQVQLREVIKKQHIQYIYCIARSKLQDYPNNKLNNKSIVHS